MPKGKHSLKQDSNYSTGIFTVLFYTIFLQCLKFFKVLKNIAKDFGGDGS